jgi:hypothetical protein
MSATFITSIHAIIRTLYNDCGLLSNSILKTEAEVSSEMSLPAYKVTRYHRPENHNLNTHRRETSYLRIAVLQIMTVLICAVTSKELIHNLSNIFLQNLSFKTQHSGL